ncbi:DUF2336 domain-containing protein [Sphingomonas sp.]|jgi:hypothetical protein|uniref:DUF2336 domain-containing protein n=1 Tax=Sphingomonas sp. TaxID=28214 RepID=UPI0035C7F3D7
MSAEPLFTSPDYRAASLAIRVAMAERRADARLETVAADVALPERERLDDRTRTAVTRLVEVTVAAIEQDIAGHAARLLAAEGGDAVLRVLTVNAPSTLARLGAAGLLRDPDLIGEFLMQARVDLIDEALLANRAPGAMATLLARLTESADGVIRQRALAYLVADSRRRLPGAPRRADLSTAAIHRLAWSIAAVLREQIGIEAVDGMIDRALVEATERSLAAIDDSEKLDTLATHLAIAIDARGDTLPILLLDALAEARMTLFIAIVAQAIAVDAEDVRALMLDVDSDRAWLLLRAAGLSRDQIAQIGWLLSEADAMRDSETLADAIDSVARIEPHHAMQAFVPLSLHPDYRRAIRGLSRSVPA